MAFEVGPAAGDRDLDRADLPPPQAATQTRPAHPDRVRDNQHTSRSHGLKTPNKTSQPNRQQSPALHDRHRRGQRIPRTLHSPGLLGSRRCPHRPKYCPKRLRSPDYDHDVRRRVANRNRHRPLQAHHRELDHRLRLRPHVGRHPTASHPRGIRVRAR